MKDLAIKRILTPVDFSETSKEALAEAARLAGLLKAQLYLIHVIELNEYFFTVPLEHEVAIPAREDLEKSITALSEKVKDDVQKNYGIEAEIFVTKGHIHTEIIEYAKNKEIDLIVMGTHGASGYKEYFIGSNSQRVVSLSDIPVLTLQKLNGHRNFKNILIPIDNSLHSREKVNIAMLMAGLFNSKIHIIGLPDSDDETELKKFKIKLESVENLVKSQKMSYVTTLVHDKHIAHAAMDYAEKNNCDLIVINTGHESRITGIFPGAFAQQIVNHSKVPVLSMKHTADHYVIDTPGFGIG